MANRKTAKNMKKTGKSNNKDKLNPVIAGATGAAVGATIGVAATAVMNSDKNKKMVGNVVNTVKEQAEEYLEAVRKGDTVKKGKKLINETVKTAKNDIQKKANEQILKARRKLNQSNRSRSSAQS